MSLRPVLALLLVVSVSGCTSSREASTDNDRLAALYDQDQADRRLGDDADWSAITRRDAERRREVQALLDAGSVRTAADQYHAAMVFQHGSDSTSFRKARDLAREADRMGHGPARWLAAAALDRHLLSIGESQHYGTQFEVQGDMWYLSPIDSTAVSDAERQRVGARTLDEIRAYLARRNGTATGSLAPPPEVEHDHAPTVELVGGLDRLASAVEYPEAARTAGVEGTVQVQLTVEPDGTVGEAFVVEGLGYGLDEEALRVVRQARFINHVGEPWEIRLAVPFAL